VSFTTEERLIGEAAKNQAAMNPANTVFDVKYVGFVGIAPANRSGVSSAAASTTKP
jgi:molecular chaperone DnaK (HSP70)